MKKRLIVLLDGLGYSEISKDKTPFLHSFSKKDSIAKLKTLLSFAGIEYSFFNGDLPDKNKIFLEFKKSQEKSNFKWQKYFWFFGRKMLSYITGLSQYLSGKNYIAPIYNIPFSKMKNFAISSKKAMWELKMFENKKYVCYKWPFLVKNGKKKLKIKYESDLERCKTMINNIADDVDLYTVQLVGLDKITHKYGKNSLKYEKKVKELDGLAKFIFEKFKEKIPNIKVIFWSDHYFLDIKKIIDARKFLPKSNEYLVFTGGTTVSFWFENQEIKKRIIKILKKVKEGRILKKKDYEKYSLPTNIENGGLIFVIKPGCYIFPNYYQGKDPYKAMHGYEPDKYDSNGILITNIKLKKKVYGLNEILSFV